MNLINGSYHELERMEHYFPWKEGFMIKYDSFLTNITLQNFFTVGINNFLLRIDN